MCLTTLFKKQIHSRTRTNICCCRKLMNWKRSLITPHLSGPLPLGCNMHDTDPVYGHFSHSHYFTTNAQRQFPNRSSFLHSELLFACSALGSSLKPPAFTWKGYVIFCMQGKDVAFKLNEIAVGCFSHGWWIIVDNIPPPSGPDSKE